MAWDQNLRLEQRQCRKGDFKVRFHCVNCPPSALGTKTKVFSLLESHQVQQIVYPDPSPDTWKTSLYTLVAVVDPEMKIPDDIQGDSTRILPFQVLPKTKKHRLSLQEAVLAQEMRDYL